MTSERNDAMMPSYAELRMAAADVGRALARARGLDPDGWFKGLPAYLSVLPYHLLRLFTHEDDLWAAVAAHHGLTLPEWRDELLDLFQPFGGVSAGAPEKW